MKQASMDDEVSFVSQRSKLREGMKPIALKSTKTIPVPQKKFQQVFPCGFIPAKTTLARALMPRQSKSEAVKNDRRSGYISCPFGT